jgi:uncharacterized protein with PIN domain
MGDRRSVLVDAMCGRLVSHLRMCGYDTVYAPDAGLETDDAIRRYVTETGRRLVTRDRALATEEDDVLLETRGVDGQLAELASAGFELELGEPTRCGACNGRLDTATGPHPKYVPDVDPVFRCRDCGQRFWQGSHWDAVADRLERARES